MATPRRAYSVYPPLIFVYLSLQAIHSLTHLTQHITAHNPSQTARTTLNLLSALALLPTVHSTRPSTAHTPRHPILSAFLISLASLIASTLRLLFLFQPRTPSNPTATIPPLILSLALSLLLRLTPPLRALHPSSPPLLRFLVAPPVHRKRRTPPPDEAVAAPALLAVLLYAASDTLTRALEFCAYITSGSVLSARVADVLAALFSAAVAFPLLWLSTRVLVHAAPARVAAIARAKCDMLMQVDGVVRCVNLRVWEESVGVFVGTVCVVVGKGVEKGVVLDKAVGIFDGVLHDLTVQVETAQGDDGE